MKKKLENSQNNIASDYIKNGYVIFKIKDLIALNEIKKIFFKIIKKEIPRAYNNQDSLNNIHEYIKITNLNTVRLNFINQINKKRTFKNLFYKIASPFLNEIVGNELVMQKKINLSIQLPNDNSSLLDIHADTWSGDSPFEVVVWLPLVDCYKTKSMYILPQSKYKKFEKNFKNPKYKNSNELFKSIKNDVIWLDIKYGEVLLFNQCLPHGNLVNKTSETRWTMNCRFKSIFTPYGDKKIGEFFEPISLKPASLLAMKYKLPITAE